MSELIHYNTGIVTYSGRQKDKEQFVRDCKDGDMYACTALLQYTRAYPRYLELDGGLGDFKTDNEFDEEQLVKGIKVELEHTNSPYIAKEIAKDHLVQDPRYYDHLEAMIKSTGYEYLFT